jgi:stage V sporulation protein S
VTQLKVSARSNPNAVAGAFAGVVREHGRAEVHVIGAGALNQAMKAVAIARGYLEEQGIDLVCVPSFVTLDVEGDRRTAIRLIVEDRGPTITLEEPEEAPELEIRLPEDALEGTERPGAGA